jgi:arsenite-transporting ATPase
VQELVFFVGKGGVGKTTISAAYAVRTALKNRGGRVLLISTDPAHSLGDILQTKVRDSPAAVQLNKTAKLTVWQMNPGALFGDFLRQHKQHMLELIERGSFFTAEEMAPLLDTALPGMSEIAGLLAIQDAVLEEKYSHIIVDTAPFGHTLRLFGLPEQFERLLNFLDLAGGRDRVLAAHFGGNAETRGDRFVEEWREKLGALQRAFADAALLLVTTAEEFALKESVRCLAELRHGNGSPPLQAAVLNRAVVHAGKCRICSKRAKAAKRAESLLRREFPGVRVYVGQDGGFPIMGARDLGRFAEHVFAGAKLTGKPATPPKVRTSQIQVSRTEWPMSGAPLAFVLGKGGVGKTTVSAGLGFECRKNSRNVVEVCSVDPAPSLDDIFQTEVGDTPGPVLGDKNFRASELDSIALFKSWLAEIKIEVEAATTAGAGGVHVDLSFERQLFSELLDIVPPGLDEVLAIFRIIELVEARPGDRQTRVIIDMAPTGHAMELMRTPERILTWSRLLLKSLAAHRKLALAREAAVKIAELQLRARELSAALKSSKRAAIFGVMLPEPLPDRETERLLDDLHEIGLSASAVFVNRVIFPRDAGRCKRCMSAMRWQQSVLSSLKRRYAGREIFVVRNFANEIKGRKGLKDLTNELWQLQ